MTVEDRTYRRIQKRAQRQGVTFEQAAAADGLDERGGSPLAALPQPGPWARLARCRSVPMSMFFPERGDDVAQAKAICERCPVLEECRAYAMAAPTDLVGIWGGLSAEQRRDLRREP